MKAGLMVSSDVPRRQVMSAFRMESRPALRDRKTYEPTA